jgi:hypothetical protein
MVEGTGRRHDRAIVFRRPLESGGTQLLAVYVDNNEDAAGGLVLTVQYASRFDDVYVDPQYFTAGHITVSNTVNSINPLLPKAFS